MKITRCKTNHLINPIGFDFSQLVLSWSVESTRSKHQKEARVVMRINDATGPIVLDTGYKMEIDNRGFEPQIDLQPYTRYYWQVTVIGDSDEATSDMNWFETGKMNVPWQAAWVTPAYEDQKISPVFKKTIWLEKPICRARVYCVGLGLYELEINGSRVGEEYFTPYCNAYDAWLQYQSFDVTESIKNGENHITALIGNGWAKGPFGTFGEMNTPYVDVFMLRLELHLTYEDGSTSVFGTDESWQCQPSAIIENTIYDGEVFDPNRLSDAWYPIKSVEPKGLGPIVERMSPPVKVMEEITPVAMIKTPAGEWVLDLGQNIAGWLRFRVHEPIGTKITLSHGEVLQEGNFYRDNLRSAKAQYTFISDGQEHFLAPKFTYFGFRYVKLEGFTNPPKLEDFTGCCVYSDIETIGHIETSDPLVNRLFSNALWSQKDNFLDVPTDCPQRDERMGWTGDAQVFSGTASFNMETYAFFSKFLRDVHEEQKFSEGMVASTVPTFSKIKHKTSSFIGGGACAWSDAATIIPWEVYLHTGDKAILKRQYQSMKDWVDWVIRRDQASGDRKLWLVDFQFGDWLALDGPVEGGVLGGTDTGLLASAYYRHSTNILAKAAAILGLQEESRYYEARSLEIKQAIQEEYFSKSGRSTVHTQTAYVAALYFDLVEPYQKQRVVTDLVRALQNNQMHLSTGFIGTPYLCRVLSDHGKSAEAIQLFFQEDYPGWLYEVVMGATTIWERWNSILPDGTVSKNGMNSLNHYAYGSIVEWLYRNVCGLKPVEHEPGFKTFIIKPEVTTRLTHAAVKLSSPMGTIDCRWSLVDGDAVTLKIQVPFNANCKVLLDNTVSETLRIIDHHSGDSEPLLNVDPIDLDTKDTLCFYLSAGTYTIEYRLKEALHTGYHLGTPLWELKQNEATKVILGKYFPHLVHQSKEALGFEFPYCIRDILSIEDHFKKGMLLRGADLTAFEKELSRIEYPRRIVNT